MWQVVLSGAPPAKGNRKYDGVEVEERGHTKYCRVLSLLVAAGGGERMAMPRAGGMLRALCLVTAGHKLCASTRLGLSVRSILQWPVLHRLRVMMNCTALSLVCPGFIQLEGSGSYAILVLPDLTGTGLYTLIHVQYPHVYE